MKVCSICTINQMLINLQTPNKIKLALFVTSQARPLDFNKQNQTGWIRVVDHNTKGFIFFFIIFFYFLLFDK